MGMKLMLFVIGMIRSTSSHLYAYSITLKRPNHPCKGNPYRYPFRPRAKIAIPHKRTEHPPHPSGNKAKRGK